MAQTLIKECSDCGLGYFKPWYEPMWLGRKNWIEAHEGYHNNSQRDYGKRLERERIIELLESLKGSCDNDCDDCRPHADKNDAYLTNLQELIKGNN